MFRQIFCSLFYSLNNIPIQINIDFALNLTALDISKIKFQYIVFSIQIKNSITAMIG